MKNHAKRGKNYKYVDVIIVLLILEAN